MKSNYTRQEILLMTNTSLSKQQWCQKAGIAQRRKLNNLEQLEEACWNGMLYEMLPGVIEKTETGRQLLLWNLKHNISSFEIDLGEYPSAIDPLFSIDPYVVIEHKLYN